MVVSTGTLARAGVSRERYAALDERIVLAGEVIDRFNDMLQQVAAMPGFDHVRYVDLRGTLSHAVGDYTEFWANELHPTPRGFELVAARFADAL